MVMAPPAGVYLIGVGQQVVGDLSQPAGVGVQIEMVRDPDGDGDVLLVGLRANGAHGLLDDEAQIGAGGGHGEVTGNNPSSVNPASAIGGHLQ